MSVAGNYDLEPLVDCSGVSYLCGKGSYFCWRVVLEISLSHGKQNIPMWDYSGSLYMRQKKIEFMDRHYHLGYVNGWFSIGI